jgi:hypothetical protein
MPKERTAAIARLSDRQLREQVTAVAQRERATTTQLVALLAEFDRRQLYLAEGYSSLFAFCTAALHLSESSAYNRICVARAARKWPAILDQLRAGVITLGALGTLAPHLTDANCSDLLAEARHKSKRDVERIVARIRPRPDVPSVIRKLPAVAPAVAPAQTNAASVAHNELPAESPLLPPTLATEAPPLLTALPPPRPVIAALSPERYKIQVTVDRETHDRLREAQDLMRHSVPNGDPAVILSRALQVLVETLLRNKAAISARMARPRSVAHGSRTIPAHVRREVWRRDKGQCAFVGPRGRCEARAFIEYHHVVPFAKGGAASVDNIELRCRAHNSHEAQLAGLARHGQARASPR